MRSALKRKGLILLMVMLMAGMMILSMSFATEILFSDVSEDSWYYNDVKSACETGLINGFGDQTFRPEVNLTYAQAVKLAACMYQKYTTGTVTLENGTPYNPHYGGDWYGNYVDYAKRNGIIEKGYDEYDWDKAITRAGFAEIFANALPMDAFKEKNTVVDGAIPDVAVSHEQATAIYKLYRAGILTGNDEKGVFYPNNNIKRSEVSAILTRMMNESARKELSLTTVSEPWNWIDYLVNSDIGDYVTFGSYEQDNDTVNGKEAIEWQVLDKKDDHVLLISKYGLDSEPYNESFADVTWENCTLRNWLNNTFLQEAFTPQERAAILSVTISNPDNPAWGTKGGNDTQDQVFLLSIDEAERYFTDNEDRKTVPTVYAVEQGVRQYLGIYEEDCKKDGTGCCAWFLRSPGWYSNHSSYVTFNGTIFDRFRNVDSTEEAVRPALWVDLKKLKEYSQDTAGVIADSWDQIIASVNDGSYKKKYHIGDTKALDLGDEGVVDMQIAAFDTDELADGSGHAGITWISKQTLKNEYRMNPMMIHSDPSDPSDLSKIQIGTGNAGGWVQSEMRSWLKEKVKPSIPSNVQNAIKPVKKYTTSMDYSHPSDDSSSIVPNSVSIEDIWIPSVREVFGNMASYEGSNGLTPYYESTGPIYEEIFNTDKDRMKQKTGTSDESVWWLRSATYKGSVASHSFVDVQSDGSGKLLTDFTAPDKKEGVVICFCM